MFQVFKSLESDNLICGNRDIRGGAPSYEEAVEVAKFLLRRQDTCSNLGIADGEGRQVAIILRCCCRGEEKISVIKIIE